MRFDSETVRNRCGSVVRKNRTTHNPLKRLVGVAGFEPATPSSRNTGARRIFNRVNETGLRWNSSVPFMFREAVRKQCAHRLCSPPLGLGVTIIVRRGSVGDDIDLAAPRMANDLALERSGYLRLSDEDVVLAKPVYENVKFKLSGAPAVRREAVSDKAHFVVPELSEGVYGGGFWHRTYGEHVAPERVKE